MPQFSLSKPEVIFADESAVEHLHGFGPKVLHSLGPKRPARRHGRVGGQKHTELRPKVQAVEPDWLDDAGCVDYHY